MRALRTAWLLALVLLEGGCGLPSSYYLNPPTGPSALDPADDFQISSSNANSEPEFRGFELYYKFYAAEGDVQNSLGGPSNDVTTLTNAHFLTVCSGADANIDVRTPPLIPVDVVDRGLAFTVTISVPVNSAASASYTTPNTAKNVQINRHVRALTGSKPFTFNSTLAGNYLLSDADMQGVMGSISGGVIYLAMYAVSYGLQDLSTPIYSYPVYLGYLRLASF